MKHKLKRFIETTFPVFILYGLAVLILTYKIGFKWGLLAIIIFSIIDIIYSKTNYNIFNNQLK